MLNPEDFKRAIQAIESLGATPAVLLKVIKLANDPDSDLDTICALLRNDGPLVADIIRISNSPFFGPATFHSNLTSAISYIGLRNVIRVVNLSLSRQLFARDLPSYGVSAHDYWSDSIAAALVMEALAKNAGLNPEDAYTVGILHSLGRVLINRVIEEKRFTIFWDCHQPIEEWERGAVGFDHAEAGAMLLEYWLFPAETCDIIRWQLDPGKVTEQLSLLGSLQFTRRLLAVTGLNFEQPEWLIPETDPFAQASGLTPAALAQLVSACRDDFHSILQSVDVS